MNPNSKLAARPFFDDADLPGILQDIEEVLRSGKLILGRHTEALEQEFAAYVGTEHAIAVSSCSAALEIALRAVGVNGKEVIVHTNTFVATANAAMRATSEHEIIVPTNTCAATANAAVRTGGKVVLCESDSYNGNFDTAAALEAVTDKTAAIVVVHVGGFIPTAFGMFLESCRELGIAVVEDCAHAHGATYHGGQAGSFGAAGCFSFYPTKIMTCGVGGMVTTNSETVAEYARSLRHHGQGASLDSIVNIGSDWLMDEMRAVLARAQLKRLDSVIAHRRAVAWAYDEAIRKLDPTSPIFVPLIVRDSTPVYYKYPVVLPSGVNRDQVQRDMKERYGIETGILYSPAVHQMPIYKSLGLSFPKTEAHLARRLCLPMHGGVVPSDCSEIVQALGDCMKRGWATRFRDGDGDGA